MIEFLLSNKLASVAGLIAAFLAFWVGVVKVENLHLRSQLDSDHILIDALNDQNQRFAELAATQNEAIKKAVADNLARQKTASLAIAKAARDTTHEKAAARIAATRSTGDDCKDTKDLVAGYIAALK